MSSETFEDMLTGGHPNSLGRTLEVVDQVMADQTKLEALFLCYKSDDEVVRLRTSNGMKRVTRAHPAWMVPFIDRLIDEIGNLDQASAQWTLADIFKELADHKLMSDTQIDRATALLKRNLANHNDWIVLNNTMKTLHDWSKNDPELKLWLQPHLERLSQDKRKSVSKRAAKLLTQ